MIEAVAVFLAGALLLYVLLGGADFGAGILEMFVNRKTRGQQKKIINEAMGPVWEVNHIWLIIAVVILFTAFPKAFSQISVTFHIPLTIMLIGIITRGCAFAFRNYDAYRDQSQKYYSLAFEVSSVLTPFSLGLILGGILLGRINPEADSFYAAFIDPWFNVFSFTLGIFTCCLVTYIASVYIIGETRKTVLRRQFVYRAKVAGIVTFIMGALLIETALYYESELFSKFYSDYFSMSCVLLTGLIFLPLWKLLNHRIALLARLMIGLQVSLIFLAWYKLQYPFIIAPSSQFEFKGLDLYLVAAPESTLKYLLIALISGSAIIFPAWLYLLRVFKFRSF